MRGVLATLLLLSALAACGDSGPECLGTTDADEYVTTIGCLADFNAKDLR